MTTDLATTLMHWTPDKLLPVISQCVRDEVTAYEQPTVEKIGRSAGPETSGIFRVAGQARTRSGERSWSAVIKVLGPPEISRSVENFEPLRELAVYRSGVFAELCGGIRCAYCYAIQEQDGLHYLWLEDLLDAPQPPWKREHFVAAAYHLGQFNAHWPEDRLPQWEWLSRVEIRKKFHSPGYKTDFDQFPTLSDHPLVRRAAPPDILTSLIDLWETSSALLVLAEATPKGVCHLDCHAKNLFPMHDARNGGYTVAVDWSEVGISSYGIDIGHMLSSATKWLELLPDQATTLVDPIFDAYVAGLAKAGWSGDEEQVRLTYLTRLGCEAIRNVGILTNVAINPKISDLVAGLWQLPIEEICDQWGEVFRFSLRCHDAAMKTARSRR